MRICTWDAVAFPGRSASESRDAPAADETRAERTAVDAETWRDVASDESLSTSRRVNEKSERVFSGPFRRPRILHLLVALSRGLGHRPVGLSALHRTRLVLLSRPCRSR